MIFTDASGEVRRIHKNPSCVVSLYASFTTLWYEAGGTVIGCIGGNTARTLYTEHIGSDITEDAGMTVIADSAAAKKWNLEKLAALHPDLILCSTAMDGYETVKIPAAAADIPVIAVHYDTFRDYLKWFKVFCHLNGQPQLWEECALAVLDQVMEILEHIPADSAPKVLSVFADASGLQANTSGTVLGEMIRMMHAVNIADGGNTGEAERIGINLESVYAADPDCILIQCHTDMDTARQIIAETYGDHPVWQSLRAVREGRVYYLDKSLFHNKPNSRFAEAYRILAEILYPELSEKT